MYFDFDENNILKGFSAACFVIMGMFFIWVLVLEILGYDGVWLSYRAFEFSVYGVFALGLYKIIKLLTQLISEMRFFRHHYIQKDTETAKVLENKGK